MPRTRRKKALRKILKPETYLNWSLKASQFFTSSADTSGTWCSGSRGSGATGLLCFGHLVHLICPHSYTFSVDDSWQETTAKDEEESNLVSENGSANSRIWNIFCPGCLWGKSKKDKDPKNDSKDVEKENIPEQEIRNRQQKRSIFG